MVIYEGEKKMTNRNDERGSRSKDVDEFESTYSSDCEKRSDDFSDDTSAERCSDEYWEGFRDGCKKGFKAGCKAGQEKAKEDVVKFIKRNRCCCCRPCCRMNCC